MPTAFLGRVRVFPFLGLKPKVTGCAMPTAFLGDHAYGILGEVYRD
ncbi:hypothetical protein [Negadavirga shengliensis]|uniref:Uncharacterized protein n=1 Tax=Negadavirga shengliensis TaxID=1389218 RepID=A0ABV9T7P2_9BACT